MWLKPGIPRTCVREGAHVQLQKKWSCGLLRISWFLFFSGVEFNEFHEFRYSTLEYPKFHCFRDSGVDFYEFHDLYGSG